MFDVDNVLADTTNCWCSKASAYLGFKVSKQDIKNDKIVGSVSMPTREIYRLQDEVWQEWRKLPPTEQGISETISALRNEGHKVVIATSRPSRSAPFVVKWLKKTRIMYDSFYSLGPYKWKADINCDVLVDDSVTQISRMVGKSKIGLLYLQPWNEKSSIKGAIRIHSLSEVGNCLKSSSRTTTLNGSVF